MGRMTIFSSDGFAGTSRVLEGSVGNLEDIPGPRGPARPDGKGWGDSVHSLVIELGTWQLFRHDSYDQPIGIPLTPGNYPDPGSWGGSYKEVSSIRLLSG